MERPRVEAESNSVPRQESQLASRRSRDQQLLATSEWHQTTCGKTQAETEDNWDLDAFHVVTLEPDCERAFYRVDGNNERLIALTAKQDPLNPIQTSPSNSHPLTDP